MNVTVRSSFTQIEKSLFMIDLCVLDFLYKRNFRFLSFSSLFSDLLSSSRSSWLCSPCLSLISKQWHGRQNVFFGFFCSLPRLWRKSVNLIPTNLSVSTSIHDVTIQVCEAAHVFSFHGSLSLSVAAPVMRFTTRGYSHKWLGLKGPRIITLKHGWR